MSTEYANGFDAGIEFAKRYFNPWTGKMTQDFPSYFVHRSGSYNCGFGEGLITGRGEKIHTTFGQIKSIYWENDNPVIKQ